MYYARLFSSRRSSLRCFYLNSRKSFLRRKFFLAFLALSFSSASVKVNTYFASSSSILVLWFSPMSYMIQA